MTDVDALLEAATRRTHLVGYARNDGTTGLLIEDLIEALQAALAVQPVQLARKITIDTAQKTVTVDGQQFPWHLAADFDAPSMVIVKPDSFPYVMFPVLCEEIEVRP